MIIVPPLAITDAEIVANNIPQIEADYDELTDYDTGERVVFENQVYESLTDTNSDAPDVGVAADPATWLLLGASNPYRIFDGLPSSQSSRTGNIDFTISTGSDIVTAVGFLNVSASSIEVTVTDEDDEVVYHSVSGMIDGANVTDWYTYFFSPIYFKSDLILLDLPPYPNAEIRVLINAGSGVARCGVALFGNQRNIGVTTYGTSVGIRDYSRKDQNQFGEYVITRRGFSKRAEFDVVVDTPHVAYVERELAAQRSSAALYVGEEGFEETLIYGFYRDFDIVLSNFTQSNCALSVEGLTYDSAEAQFFAASINAPFIYTPENNDTVPNNAIIRTEPFATYPDGSDTHASTDWEIADDAAFSNIVYSSLADATNLESLPMPSLTDSTDYWVRAVHNSAANGASPVSNVVAFTYSDVAGSVSTPSMTSPTAGEMETLTPTVTTSAFSGTNDEHYATDWQIATDDAFTEIVYDNAGDTTNLTSLTVPADTLETYTTYYVRARHVPKWSAASAWAAEVEFSAVAPEAFDYTTPTSTQLTVPAGVTHFSAVAIGGGEGGDFREAEEFGADGGNGGGLAWISGWAVSEGDVIEIIVPAGTQSTASVAFCEVRVNDDYISVFGQTRLHSLPAEYDDYGGGNGGTKGFGNYDPAQDADIFGGGGGAGGYLGSGGNGGGANTFGQGWNNATAGAANSGGAGGGFGTYSNVSSGEITGKSGGGVGLYGVGATGAAGSKGGSGGADGGHAQNGGLYGGGGAGANVEGDHTAGGNGAVRIIWGKGYSYPSNAVIED